MKSKISLVFVVSILLAMLIQGQGRSEPSERKTGDVATFTLPGGATLEMVWIEPGTFMMGSPRFDPSWSSQEGPQHEVTITKGFYLGKYELTQGQWEAVIGTRPWVGQSYAGRSYVRENPNHPAVYISWYDVQSFIERLNEAEGSGVYRLPTEAEWEYACRAGTTTWWSFGDDERKLKDYAWYRDNTFNVGEEYAHEVGTKLPNPWGLYDMHGNVEEWCEDLVGMYSSSAQIDPTGPSSGPSSSGARIIRSGEFNSDARFARSASRMEISPEKRQFYAGARLLRRAAILKGDINQDEIIDVQDVILCLRIVDGLSLPAGHTTPTEHEAWAADIDGDRKVTSGDALQILTLAVERVLRQEP